METPAAPHATASPSGPLRAVVLVAFAAYVIFLALHLGAYAGGADSSGYLNHARLLAAGQAHTPQRVLAGATAREFSPNLFVPLGFRPTGGDTMTPTYPVGLPLLVAGTAQVAGWPAAPHLVMAISALFGLVLTALLARELGLPWAWTWFGAFALGVSPLYTIMSLQLMSDVPATAAATAALVCAWRSRRHPAWAVVAGGLTAVAVLVRPSNILLGAPVLLCLGRNWQCWLGCALGGLPGAVAHFGYNARAYGEALESGYGDIFAIFSWSYVPANLAVYGRWLWVVVPPVGLALLGLPWAGRRPPALVWALLVWCAGMLTFYAGYKHTADTWWSLRFVLPMFPAAIVGGLWVLHAGWERFRRFRPGTAPVARRNAVVATLAIFIFGVAWSYRLSAASVGRAEARYPAVARWLQTHLPADAVVAAMQGSGALHCYTGFTLFRYDMLRPGQFAAIVDLCRAARRPVYAAMWPNDLRENQALSSSLAGNWRKIGQIETVTVWELLPAPTMPPPATGR